MVGIADMTPGGRLTAGEVFADYTIVRFLGSGGMGEVYLAEHPRLPRREALKILGGEVSADDDYRRRFIREADLAAELWHPNIVRVNDRGEFHGQLWLAMDFVDGSDAATLVREHYPVGMPADQVAPILSAIARALDYAHEHHHLMHRDVSPANILLTKPQHDNQRILLSDFGIARSISDTSGLTATNMTIGTFPYAAPEQLTDEPIDGRADQYALAASVYHLLTGSPLFPHTNPAVVIGRHLSAPPPKLAETQPMLRVFDPVLAVALAKDPADRFARCTDFAEAFIRATRTGRHPATSVSTMPRPLAIRPAKAAPATDADTDSPQRRGSGWAVLAAASAVIGLTAIAASGGQPEAGRTADGQNTPSVASPVAAPPQHQVAEPPPAAPPAPPAAPTPQAAPSPALPAAAAPAPRAPAGLPKPPAAPAPAAKPPVAQPPAPPQPPANPDQTYLNLVSGIPGVTVTDPSVAVTTGRNLCTVLQNGGSPSDAANATVNNNEGITPAQAAAGVNAAITVYCPQYQR
ncbi:MULTISPECIES: serine/threonine-protein kinase [Mycobacterium]|nr:MULTISPECIES: serine/threonine-protein kinase [Mycobacterium]